MYNNNPTQATYAQQQYQINRPIYPMMMPQQYVGIKGRPVASIEEARASIIDFDGSIFYFPDLANKKIYTKQISMDGTAILNMYELKEIPIDTPENNSSQYITREEFEAALAALRQGAAIPQPAPIPEPVSKPANADFALNF